MKPKRDELCRCGAVKFPHEYHMNKLPKIIKRQKDGSYTVHTQIVFFKDGNKKTIMGVKWVWENQMIHLVTDDSQEYIINRDNVLFIQRYLEFKNDPL